MHPHQRELVRLFELLLAAALATGNAGPATPQVNAPPKTHTITIENMRFNPEVLTVKRGDHVVWVNKDLFPHTATADAKNFDSGSIATDASWAYVVRKPGAYAFSCTFHPMMKGKLTVEP